MRILIAEDDDDLRDLLVLVFEKGGWEVFAAKDGRVALKMYHNAMSGYEITTNEDGSRGLRTCDAGYFDVLLLDVVMPRLNGFAVGINIRNFESYGEGIPRAAHVYLTGKEDVIQPEQIMEAEFAGDLFADAYIRKPIGPVELLAEIDRLVARKEG